MTIVDSEVLIKLLINVLHGGDYGSLKQYPYILIEEAEKQQLITPVFQSHGAATETPKGWKATNKGYLMVAERVGWPDEYRVIFEHRIADPAHMSSNRHY